ncbi:MAG: rhodanese-like domain-containing protein [Flavobacteriaceae bacterium]
MKRFIFFLLITSAINFGCKETTTEESIKLVTPDEMKELSQMDGVQLVDVRTPEEYQEGYIEGFQNIDFLSDTFLQDVEKLDKEKPVIVYCRSGGRSARCSKLMVEKGFKKVYDLDGGISKWKSEGNEIVIEPESE